MHSTTHRGRNRSKILVIFRSLFKTASLLINSFLLSTIKNQNETELNNSTVALRLRRPAGGAIFRSFCPFSHLGGKDHTCGLSAFFAIGLWYRIQVTFLSSLYIGHKGIYDKINSQETNNHTCDFTKPVSSALPCAVFHQSSDRRSGASGNHDRQTMANSKQ